VAHHFRRQILSPLVSSPRKTSFLSCIGADECHVKREGIVAMNGSNIYIYIYIVSTLCLLILLLLAVPADGSSSCVVVSCVCLSVSSSCLLLYSGVLLAWSGLASLY
jgi:hypothetical protein